MNQNTSIKKTDNSSWLDKLSNALMREPQDREQLVQLLRESERNNLIDADALSMIESVLQFSEIQVRDIMIPRAQMVTLNEIMTLDQCLPIIINSGHSRFPVLSDNKDEVIGILHAKDILQFYHDPAKKFVLKDIVRPAVFIPLSKKIDILLKEFRSNRNHMGIVVDEYGSACGFATIEDIIEQIIGDIEDEFDIDEDAYIKKIAKQQYIIKAHTPIDEFNEYFSTQFSDKEFDTIAGLVIHEFGYLPERGEKIALNRYEFEVLLADSRRVRLLKAVKVL